MGERKGVGWGGSVHTAAAAFDFECGETYGARCVQVPDCRPDTGWNSSADHSSSRVTSCAALQHAIAVNCTAFP